MPRAAFTVMLAALALMAGVVATRVAAAPGSGGGDRAGSLEGAHSSAAHHANGDAPCENARYASTAAPCSLLAAPSRTPQPASPDRHGARREPGRQAPATAAGVHRPTMQRSRATVRTHASTPGVGLLLRIGTGEGRELSMNMDRPACDPEFQREGRGPPRAPASADPDDPPAQRPALLPSGPTPVRESIPDAAALPLDPATPLVSARFVAPGAAPSCAPDGGIGPDLPAARLARAHVDRTKGATA